MNPKVLKGISSRKLWYVSMWHLYSHLLHVIFPYISPKYMANVIYIFPTWSPIWDVPTDFRRAFLVRFVPWSETIRQRLEPALEVWNPCRSWVGLAEFGPWLNNEVPVWWHIYGIIWSGGCLFIPSRFNWRMLEGTCFIPFIWFYDIYFTGRFTKVNAVISFWVYFVGDGGRNLNRPNECNKSYQKIHPMIQVCQGFPPMPCCNKKHAHPGADECIKISPSSVCPQVLFWKKIQLDRKLII